MDTATAMRSLSNLTVTRMLRQLAAEQRASLENDLILEAARRIEPTCEWFDEVWGPNEGCREFMDTPEEIVCGEPATKLVTLSLPQGLPLIRPVSVMCAAHAIRMATEEATNEEERRIQVAVEDLT